MSRNRQGDDGAGPSSISALDRVNGHAFLQAMMQRAYMRESDAKELYKKICNQPNDSGYINAISQIGGNIESFGFLLRRGKWPGDNETYIGFVNTDSDESSKRATRFLTKDGRPDIRYSSYFRALLERIAEHPGSSAAGASGLGWITTREALNLDVTMTAEAPPPQTQGDGDEAGPSRPTSVQITGAAAQPFRLTDREAALAAFVADGWLAFTPDQASAYSLGPRSFLELGDMLSAMDLQPVPRAALNKAQGL